MAAHRQLQMLVTRFERLSRRISLSGLLSGHKAEEAIAAGRVLVDGTVATSNFKVFSEASVTVDGRPVRAPEVLPRLWGLRKPKKVLCEQGEREGTKTLRTLMRGWREKEMRYQGKAQGIGLAEEALDDKHFVVVCGLPYGGDGLVLLTNDALFAEALVVQSSRIMTIYDIKVAGDPPVDLLHSWRRGARVDGVNFGPVFCSIWRRSPVTTWLRLRLVETPDRPVDVLLERARLRVNRLHRHAFGPYVESSLPKNRLVQLPVHRALKSFVPKADMRQVLVPSRGGIVSEEGHLRGAGLDGSTILETASRRECDDHVASSDGDAFDFSCARWPGQVMRSRHGETNVRWENGDGFAGAGAVKREGGDAFAAADAGDFTPFR